VSARTTRAFTVACLLTAAVALAAPGRPVPPAPRAPAAALPATGHTVKPGAGRGTRPAPRAAAGRTPRQDVAVTVRVVARAQPGPEAVPPTALALWQNVPNPFAGTTTIRYALPSATACQLAVYSVTGQRLATLLDWVQPAGEYAIDWNGTDDAGRRLRAGLYFLRLTAGPATRMRKIVLR